MIRAASIARQRLGRASLALVAALALLFSSLAARADEPPEELFARGSGALSRGEYAAAIEAFEALADQGFTHPDASYDRGFAYLMRVRARADRPGDLGRAAAAFEEALLLRPDDRDAELALDLVRAEVTRRRSRRAKDAVDVRPTLDRMVVGLATEETWGAAAFAASLLLAAGLVLRRRPAGALHVAGSVLAPTALALVIVLAPLAYGARSLRLATQPGVIVVTEAFLTDADGRAVPVDPVPEAASVEVGERRGGLVHVRWGATEGWTAAAGVRLLGPPL